MSLYIHLFVCDIVCMFIYVKQDETKTLKENSIQWGKNIESTNHELKNYETAFTLFSNYNAEMP
jgi:hypothetical protein